MDRTSESPVINKDDYIGYGSFYNMFFGIGIAVTLVVTGLIIWIGFIKNYQRTNPLGVLFNMLLVQLFLSFRVFIVGLFY